LINTNLHPILYVAPSELSQIVGQIFALDTGIHTRSEWTSKFRTTKFSFNKLKTSLCRIVLT